MLTLKERLDKLVDPDYGLIKYISVLPRSPDEANIFVGLAIIQDPLALPPQSEFTRLNAKDMKQGAGCGFTLEECLWSTVGESVERYAACVYDVKDLKISSFSQLSERDEAIDPRRFIRFSDEQYKKPGFVFSAPQPDDQIAWTVGVNVLTGVQTYVPASLVYMYYSALTPKDSRIDKGYSTGLAAGSNYFMAIHSGLREVLERDAYALHWFSKRTAPRIDMEQLKKNTTPNIRKLLEQANAHIELRDYTTDLGIPCVLSQIKTSCFGGVASGSSSNLNGLRCNEKALIESFHTLNWCIDMLKHHQVMELEDIVQYEHHVRYYFTDRPESRHNLDFLTADAPL
ncbi:MAG: YcaO-like family protein, partial [Pseudomonadota bacterium]